MAAVGRAPGAAVGGGTGAYDTYGATAGPAAAGGAAMGTAEPGGGGASAGGAAAAGGSTKWDCTWRRDATTSCCDTCVGVGSKEHAHGVMSIAGT